VFYLLYPVGLVIVASGAANANWQQAALMGAPFGFFCYATFDLTSLALLRSWTWPAAIVDVSRGAFVTAVSAVSGLLIANAVTR
jgi:uncharacterized membrane protein